MLTELLERKLGTCAMPDHCRWLVQALAVLMFSLAVTPPAQAQDCSGPGDPICNDGISCTDDMCVCGAFCICFNISNCADELVCNGTELCCTTSGGCDGTPWGECQPGTPIVCGDGEVCSETVPGCTVCETDSDCDDENDCTADVCIPDPGDPRCEHTPLPGQACSDDDLCTNPDTCAADVCVGQPVVCNDGNDCTADTCNPSSGACEFFPLGEGANCDDNDLCTPVDECHGGVCVGGPKGGCVDLELRGPEGPIAVGDVVDIQLRAIRNGCPPPPAQVPCPVGTQAVVGMQVVFTWDPAIFELADPAETGTCNPEDPCDDPDPCVVNCGEFDQYNWGTSLYPNDCAGDGINAPCIALPCTEGVPGNDGNAKYLAFAQLQCDGQPAPPACVPTTGLWVTSLKFKVLGATAGVSGPTAITLENCITQSRTFVNGGSTPGEDVTGALGEPVLLDIQCVSDSDCPFGPCVDGECIPCPAPIVEVEGSRYLAVTPAEGVAEVGILVTGAEPQVACVSGYAASNGIMGSTPFFQPPGPGGWDTVHVRGEKLVGGMTYDVYADCDASSPGTRLSEPVSVTMWRWGDVDGNTVVNIMDAVRILDGFVARFHTILCATDAGCSIVPPHFTCDMEIGRCLWITVQNVDIIAEGSCIPNGVISIFDVLLALDAFRGLPDSCGVSCP